MGAAVRNSLGGLVTVQSGGVIASPLHVIEGFRLQELAR